MNKDKVVISEDKIELSRGWYKNDGYTYTLTYDIPTRTMVDLYGNVVDSTNKGMDDLLQEWIDIGGIGDIDHIDIAFISAIRSHNNI